ncbi:hypothetical protein PHMEG_0005724 [Phytophthora megakarya]|uniref:cellulose 1,4-beta-cellobiosidase (non-reducing end) n=1 Tax=Phytophthora megakarya TaxID=4795 RepID=A0A225WS07_9STRA|nr:hypothetical protein PHMEG_0005724 [Phytophthora megakarya]
MTSGNSLNLKLKTPGGVVTRAYMLDASGEKYKQLQLLNQAFSFEVDMSTLSCVSTGALYFLKMDDDGGTSRFPGNTAVAAYGTGYCDAQYQRTVMYINGANLNNSYGACCAEKNIWEANSMTTANPTHSCTIDGQQRCITDEDAVYN